eukprot:Hpha_TRINITY_DN16190_c1_g12::TRINITY_DN16190_c1_g12_i1::g.5094::m.5094
MGGDEKGSGFRTKELERRVTEAGGSEVGCFHELGVKLLHSFHPAVGVITLAPHVLVDLVWQRDQEPPLCEALHSGLCHLARLQDTVHPRHGSRLAKAGHAGAHCLGAEAHHRHALLPVGDCKILREAHGSTLRYSVGYGPDLGHETRCRGYDDKGGPLPLLLGSTSPPGDEVAGCPEMLHPVDIHFLAQRRVGGLGQPTDTTHSSVAHKHVDLLSEERLAAGDTLEQGRLVRHIHLKRAYFGVPLPEGALCLGCKGLVNVEDSDSGNTSLQERFTQCKTDARSTPRDSAVTAAKVKRLRHCFLLFPDYETPCNSNKVQKL